MYTPAQFKVDNVSEAHALMRAHPFAILVTNSSNGIIATHLPTALKVEAADALGRIECHVARPNPQWKTFAPQTDALMIFQAVEAYIRPGWYPSKAEHGKVVPTWNYSVVHAYGRLEAIEDIGWLSKHVTELTEQQETGHAMPWSTADAPGNFIEVLARGIVGLRFTLTRLEAKAKMSQNRPPADRAGVVEGLAERAHGDDGAVAELVKKLNPS